MNKNNCYNQLSNEPEDMNPYCSPNGSCDENIYAIGNNVNFTVDEKDNEIKADIVIGFRKSIRVWGQIKDCNDRPVPCAYVKLLKNTPNGFVGVAHTITDCRGFYQFDICLCKDGSLCKESCNYSIIVGKAATGDERIISTGLRGTNCNIPGQGNPCYGDSCMCQNPCKK